VRKAACEGVTRRGNDGLHRYKCPLIYLKFEEQASFRLIGGSLALLFLL